MGFLDWYDRDRKLTDYAPGELRRVEERLTIRETQSLSRLERLEKEREEIFRRGALSVAPTRRRVLARLFARRQRECEEIERSLSHITKEALIVSGIRFRIEKRLEGDSSALKKVAAKAVDGLAGAFEDETVDGEEFAGQVRSVLGKVKGGKDDPLRGIGQRAKDVLAVWNDFDAGGIAGVEEGLAEIRKRMAPVDEEE